MVHGVHQFSRPNIHQDLLVYCITSCSEGPRQSYLPRQLCPPWHTKSTNVPRAQHDMDAFLTQAQAVVSTMRIDLALNLVLREEVLVEKCLGELQLTRGGMAHLWDNVGWLIAHLWRDAWGKSRLGGCMSRVCVSHGLSRQVVSTEGKGE
eukprot:450755-Pelagomonas_calceolata.AAC.14